MVLSGYLIKIPYWLCWQGLRMAGRLDDFVFYVDSEHDYNVIENMLPHMEQSYRIAARNTKVAKALRQRGVEHVTVWPVFPKVLLMARHAFHRFPISGIKKIGIKHGTYFFKQMISARKYNMFDLYLFTTEAEAGMAAERGVRCGTVGGQPKLDTFFLPSTLEKADRISQQPGFDTERKTLLFTTTWDRSGLSAIDRWIDHLDDFTGKYNVCVSLHPMMSEHYFTRIQAMDKIFFATPEWLPAFMQAADVLISDTSSVMGEFCALDKPIITFRVESGHRLTEDVKMMIAEISVSVQAADELEDALLQYEKDPELKRAERLHWQKIFYGDIHWSHGAKAAEVVCAYLKEIGN